MVHEAMVLEYSGRHLAVIELAAAAEAAALYLAHRLHLFPWGLAPTGGGLGGLCRRRRRPTWASSPSAAFCSCCSRLDRQDARVPRAGIPGRRAHARPARHAAAVSCRGASDGRTFAFDIAHMLAGGLVLVSFMLLYQDRMFALLNVFALHAVVLVAVGRLAGLHPERAASLRHGGDRARAQGHHHPGGAASHRRAARHPPHDRDGRSASARPCWPASGSSRCRWS